MEYSLQLLKMLAALAGVLGCFYLVVKFIKTRNLFNQTNQLKILERCHLGQNQVIYLLEVVDDIWLVTSTEQEIQFVQEIAPEKVEDLNINQQSSGLLTLFQRINGRDEDNES